MSRPVKIAQDATKETKIIMILSLRMSSTYFPSRKGRKDETKVGNRNISSFEWGKEIGREGKKRGKGENGENCHRLPPLSPRPRK